MKLFRWFSDNIFFVITLFLLAFIPLYPKKPILDIVNTWVYVRAEDFVVGMVLLVWIVYLFRKKITLRTPLTQPILLFWLTGAIATIHGVLLIFPHIANVFPNVAFLSFLRRIEYFSLFFVAFAAMRHKALLKYVIIVLVATLLTICAYGFGQKYLGFPAYLTMNEEFAKGIPIQLSALSRVPSTFAGHYDLAAYLVLVLPILTSLLFGFRNWFIKLFLLGSVLAGFVLLFMTVSRVSFFVLFIALGVVLLFQKRRLVMLSLPIIGIIAFLFISLAPTLVDRFGNTVSEVDVLVNAKTGEAIGHVKEVDSSYFDNKTIRQKVPENPETLDADITKILGIKDASPSAFIPKVLLPPKVTLLVPPNAPTGENLPQGTGYINLSLSPVTKKLGMFLYENPNTNTASESAQVLIVTGDYLVKRAAAYDLSFTTRFQGEWPNALTAFERNILFGSGYGSISLAIDNNYLRILGEIGLLGMAAFLAIFIVLGMYIRRVLPDVDSPVVRSFVVGVGAGIVGLGLNAILIDVFEASKIAFTLWLLVGITVGMLALYQAKPFNPYKELKTALTSSYAVITYLLITTTIIFSPMMNNFFVGDDFTWFRWATECQSNTVSCIGQYFTQSDGFFYRPGTKTFFLLMYKLFWLNQTVYHIASIALHFGVASLLFLLAKKVLQSTLFAAIAGFLFLIISGYGEAVFWISSIGHPFSAFFSLASVLLFIQWEEKRNHIFYILALLSFVSSMLFHEMGIVTPLLILAYKFAVGDKYGLHIFRKIEYAFFALPIVIYLGSRFLASSHWFSGDYSYNLLKLPFNIIGNGLGYFLLVLLGPIALPIQQMLRMMTRENIALASAVLVLVISVCVYFYKYIWPKINPDDKKVLLFSILFFGISLITYLGLGNITSRYSYLAAGGLVILFAFFVKKIYHYLLNSGKDVAIAGVSVIVAFFSLLHIIQLQQLHSDWYEAGEKTRRFFVSIDGQYADYWATEPMQFHFVNVPLKVGEAWVFPVGLSDALYLVFRNPNITTFKSGSVEQSLDTIDISPNEKVFEFDESGRVIERKKKVIRSR